MFDFLVEGGLTLYLTLLVVGLFLFALWWQRRDKRYLFGILIVAAVAVILFLLDYLGVTDLERAKSTLQRVITNLNRNSLDGAFADFADDFQAYGMDKATLKEPAGRKIKAYEVRNFHAKNFTVKTHDRKARTMTLRFDALADSSVSDWRMVPCEVDFEIDAQDRCRIKSFRVYKPLVDNMDPWDVFKEAW